MSEEIKQAEESFAGVRLILVRDGKKREKSIDRTFVVDEGGNAEEQVDKIEGKRTFIIDNKGKVINR